MAARRLKAHRSWQTASHHPQVHPPLLQVQARNRKHDYSPGSARPQCHPSFTWICFGFDFSALVR